MRTLYVPPAVSEAHQTLVAQVGRKSPLIPPSLLARHILSCVPPQEWPTRVAAMDALLRRLDSARKEELRIVGRPPKGRVLGTYATGRPREKARPYRTVLTSVDPIEGRCDCPDFVKNSLGVCKHLLAVLETVHGKGKERRLKQASKEQEAARESKAKTLGLFWDPVRPLTGAGDWLERVVWRGEPDSRVLRSKRRARALRRFRSEKSGDPTLRRTYPDDPAKRLALVEDLLALHPSSTSPDPALGTLLEKERERVKQRLEHVPAPSEVREGLKGLKRPLYPYQKTGVERFLSSGRLLLADDMGLGKTAQAIAATDVLWRSGRIRRGLIIAPASLKSQWEREWATFSDLPIQVIDATPGERHAIYASTDKGLFIINYEQLLRDFDAIRDWRPDLVVLDEAQRIKNWATKTALSVKKLAPPYRLILTGTPMENRVEELASVVEWVDDWAMEPKWRLPAFHAMRADGKREVIGVRHLETLRERLRPCLLRRVRQEVLEQLPPRTDTRVPVEMTEPQMEEHDSLNQPIAQLIQRSLKRPLTQAEFLRLMSLLTTQRIISNGLCQLNFEHVWPSLKGISPEESMIHGLCAPKLLELRQLVRQIVLDQGRKAVIFSQWRRMLTLAQWAVGDLLAEENLHGGSFTGSEGQKRRTQNIVEFHDDPQFRLLFASDAGGVGLNLQRAANCVINLELPWNPAVLEQRIGRVYRLGQTLPIDVYNLVSEQGIESRIASLVGSKQAFFKGLFDGESDTIRFEESTSFLSRVRTIYRIEETEVSSDDSDLVEIDMAAYADTDPDADEDLDENLDAALTPILDAADESLDRASASAPEPPPPLDGQAAASEVSAPSESDSAMPPAPEAPAPPPVPSLPTSGEVRQLFSRLAIRRQDDGKVIIEAPPDAASTLGALFEGLAALLHASASSPPPPPDSTRG